MRVDKKERLGDTSAWLDAAIERKHVQVDDAEDRSHTIVVHGQADYGNNQVIERDRCLNTVGDEKEKRMKFAN